MQCPLCKIGLQETILCNTAVNYCPRCLGLWFEEEELRWAKDSKDKDLNWLDVDLWKEKKRLRVSPREILCPACRLPVYETRYGRSRIKVDICNICQGIWLDRGEFKKIIEHLKKEADWQVLNNYAKNLLAEAFEVFSGPETLREEVEDFLTILKLLKYKFATQHPVIANIISKLPR